LICAAVFTSVLASRKLSFLVLGLDTLIIVIFMILYVKRFHAVSLNLDEYRISLSSWITMLTGFVLFIRMLLGVTAGLFRNLKELIEKSSFQLDKNRELNTTIEQEVESRTRKLTESNEQKNKIIGVVSHYINNKLSLIVGYLDLLIEGYESLTDNYEPLTDKERLKYSSRALESSILANDIVIDLLEFAQSQERERIFTTERVDICTFVQSTVECHMPRALEERVKMGMGTIPRYAFCNINKARLCGILDKATC
jgi:signal transduction histidine kinase